MAKIRDFLEQLEPKTYTDEELTRLAKDFGLEDKKQIPAVISHDLHKIRNEIKRESGDPKGELLRVVM
ncbi:MAG: hypothetical protein ACR2GT_05210 [Gaiellaceae bacterium]